MIRHLRALRELKGEPFSSLLEAFTRTRRAVRKLARFEFLRDLCASVVNIFPAKRGRCDSGRRCVCTRSLDGGACEFVMQVAGLRSYRRTDTSLVRVVPVTPDQRVQLLRQGLQRFR